MYSRTDSPFRQSRLTSPHRLLARQPTEVGGLQLPDQEDNRQNPDLQRRARVVVSAELDEAARAKDVTDVAVSPDPTTLPDHIAVRTSARENERRGGQVYLCHR